LRRQSAEAGHQMMTDTVTTGQEMANTQRQAELDAQLQAAAAAAASQTTEE